MDKLKIVELKELARKNKLKGYSTLAKAGLVDFLKRAGVRAPEPTPVAPPRTNDGRIDNRTVARRELPENIRYRDRVPAFTERKKVPIIRKADGTPGKRMVPSKKKAVEITDLKGVKKGFLFTERKGKKKPKKITPLQPANRFNSNMGDEAELRAAAMKSIGKPNELYRRDNVKDSYLGDILGWRDGEMVLGPRKLKKKTKELRLYNKAVAIHEENQKRSHRKLKKLNYLTERDREKQGYRKPKKITELKGVGGKGGGLPKEIKGLPEKKNTKDYKQLDTGKSSGRPKKVLDTVETRPKPAFLISSYIDKPEQKNRTSTFNRRSQMSEDERHFWDNSLGDYGTDDEDYNFGY